MKPMMFLKSRRFLTEQYQYYTALYDGEIIHNLISEYSADHSSQVTPQPISCFGISFNSTKKSVVHKFGQPRFKTKKKYRNFIHDVYFFRLKYFDQDVVVQYHFIENSLFYGKLSFVGYLNDCQKEEIKTMICKKYLTEENIGRLNSNYKITDGNRNFIQIKEDIYLYVSYRSYSNHSIHFYLTKENENRIIMESERATAHLQYWYNRF
jgi:hypothetical protein